MRERKGEYWTAPYPGIPGTWCLQIFVYGETQVGLYQHEERGRVKLFHSQDEARAYAKQSLGGK